MDMPFYFFFGLLGLAVGALVVWLLLADHPFEAAELPTGPVDAVEATMLVAAMAKRGRTVDEETVVDLIEVHNAYVEGRIEEELALAAADRIEAARAKTEAEDAQTATILVTYDPAVASTASTSAAPASAASRRSSRAVRTRKSASSSSQTPGVGTPPDGAPTDGALS
jgi:hypothetical protein